MPIQDDAQHHEQDTGTVTPERGSEDEAIALLNQRARVQTTEEAQETPADETETDQDDGTQQGDPEAEDEGTEKLVEVEYEGEHYMVRPELREALLRKADYSRNMQELAATRKDYTQRIETAQQIAENAEKLADAIAVVKGIDADLKRFESIDWQQLRLTDRAEFAAQSAEFQALRIDKQQAVAAAQAVGQQVAQGRARDFEAKRVEMVKALSKQLPGWGEELGAKISKYAQDCGFSADELQRFTDPRVVVALEKARKFDAIQSGKATAIAKAKETPSQVLKPGQPRRVDKTTEAQTRFQRSKSPEDAVALLQARAAGTRR